jgi:hypothetical protein
MPRSRLTLLLALPLIAAAACDDVPPWRAAQSEPATQAPADFGPTAAYERRLVFLGPGQRLPTAAIMDFVALSDSLGLRRGVRVRLVDGVEWTALMDAGWEMDPLREPWTLVPHGPLRLVAGDAGDLSSIVFKGDVEVRLEPGSSLAEYSPDRGTHLVLRQARLSVGGDLVHGLLLDVQLGRRLDPAMSRPTLDPETGRSPADADETADETAVEAGGAATPSGRPGAEALLLDNAGFYLVFATSATGQFGWVHHEGRDDLLQGARLVGASLAEADGGVRVPNRWQIAGHGTLTGELTAEVVEGVEVGRPAEIEGLGYAVVTGWVDYGDGRRDVFGIVRHAR